MNASQPNYSIDEFHIFCWDYTIWVYLSAMPTNKDRYSHSAMPTNKDRYSHSAMPTNKDRYTLTPFQIVRDYSFNKPHTVILFPEGLSDSQGL